MNLNSESLSVVETHSNQSPQRTGTQSIERVVSMIRVVASRGRSGMRIGEIVTTSGLPQSTCFRMLQRMEVEGLVNRDPHTRKYYLGPLLHELGLLARPRYRLSELCDAAMHHLADVTHDTIYLSERSNMEAVCTNRVLGDFPIKALALDIGIRRPLGVGAGGGEGGRSRSLEPCRRGDGGAGRCPGARPPRVEQPARRRGAAGPAGAPRQ